MQVLYEEGGDLKVGAVLEQAPASFQVETLHGRRAKVKAANVLLAFERPGGAELLAQAQLFATGLDTEFLWQCSAGREFAFQDLAREYVGREPSAVEAAGVLIKLHAAPIFFYRRGKGRFQAAPEQTLKLALAGVEKKKRVHETIAAWAAALARFDCPREIAALKDELLYAPDGNKPEAKALEQACRETGLAPARLFERCGLLADTRDYHLKRFLHEFFPHGSSFPPHEMPLPPADLPLASVRAFSLDDVGTTEIDDAFSVQRTASGELRVGIHIAAPALGIAQGSPLDAIARGRLSTAYLPGCKFTMLPEDVIERFSLDHGGEQPALSLYFDVSEHDGSVRGTYSRIERVPIAANLRHAEYDVLNEAFESGAKVGLPFEDELRTLWRIAGALEARRDRPGAGAMTLDYSFYVENGRVRIVPRKRGAPLDKLVAEMMIFINSTWGELLAEHDERAPFARNSDALLGALRAFEVTYARYDEHQRAMETYWTLRWLQQEAIQSAEATVLRENLVRFDHLPLVMRVSSLPALDPGTRVRLDLGQVDFLERTLSAVYRETLGRGVAVVDDDTAPTS